MTMASPNNPNSQFGNRKEDVREDEPFGDADHEEAFLDCETQILDFGDETQLVHLDEEMQDIELAGETQVMDDYDFIQNMDTQLIDFSDNETECRSYGEEEQATQLLNDTDEIQGDSYDQATSNAQDTTHDGEATTESLSSFDTDLSTGERKNSKNADGESCSSEFRNESVNVEKVNVGHDMEQGNDKELSNENKRKDDRSLVENFSVDEERSHDSFSGQRTNTHLLSSCHEESAGLSYVDSQEPGELSQANAIEFIDKFLKVNVLESDQDKTLECAVGEIVTPCTIAKGPQSLAQQTNRRSTITGATVFEWNDALEDGGGGEFFIKKKNQLIGTSCGAQKSSSKSQRPEPVGAELAGKHKSEREPKNIQRKVRQSIHFDSKVVKSKKKGRLKKTMGKKETGNTDQLLGSDCGDREVPDLELVDVPDVGIDTQMAAEAMEVLSTGRALLTVDSSTADEDQEIGREMCENVSSRKSMQKKSSVGTRTCLSSSDLGIGSKRTRPSTRSSHEELECSIALRTRSKFAVEEFKGDLLKTKSNHGLDMKNSCDVNEQEPSGIESVKIGNVKRANMVEQELLKTGSLPVKKRSSRVKISSSASASCKTRHHVNVNNLIEPDDASGGSRVQRGCLHLEQAGRAKRKRSTTHYGVVNARDKVLNPINATDVLVDGTNDRGGDNTSTPNTTSAKNKSLLASMADEVVSQFITRRKRSMCKAQSSNVILEDKSLHSGKMLSAEEHHQSSSKKRGACSPPAKEGTSASAKSPEKEQNSSSPAIVTPINLKTPRSAVSPICVGDEYSTPSCRKALSLKKEFYRLTSTESLSPSPCKDLRPRRDISNVRVLFSRHLDDDIIRQQKKIMSRLGVLVASSISDATHFVADSFVRTRNMLEAIANGKPVVTHLWLDSCGQSSCFIDEKNYILRDAKKERELGFSMPNSLTRAIRHPLLEGRRVFITPNTKPGKEILTCLVKAVHGLAIERLCRSMSNNDSPPDDLLVLSCEEDFRECVPLLEKGIGVYSSELVLNGIITQRMEYERYVIFVDHAKKTRSTFWVKKNGQQFLPVTKSK